MARIVEAKLANQEWSAALTFESRRGGVEGALLMARRKLDVAGRVMRSHHTNGVHVLAIGDALKPTIIHVRMRRAPTSGPTLTQEQRRASGARQVVSLTLAAESIRELDKRRGDMSRGAFVERLLRGAS